ncbi:BLUF domain-containing protein [Hymenobacter yonginensis]|uniref:BLUF domain-containing protein n=1 Tax=Hymenobacter yonginensis TaxID=748197 RepID=A0ABY7PRM4_9BACT|nr:BLUF domain-containing protein [Hymenobacter yonginensis]WBO85454.1 BLUF domain-containing protein [Hymenobacter yonginensis]
MHRIVYLSSATGDLDEQQLKDLLLHSRRKNQARAITGLLLVSEGDILQVLEGERQAVEQLYDLIARDVRHSHIYKLADGPIPERAFPDWSMGFATATPETFEQLAGYRNLDSAGFLITQPQNMDTAFFEVLREFATLHTANF